jgi:hypothetical protein
MTSAAEPSTGHAAEGSFQAEPPNPRYATRYTTGADSRYATPAGGPTQSETDAMRPSAGQYVSGGSAIPPGQTGYEPGNTGYEPGNTGYEPGNTGYAPTGVAPYRSPAGAPGSYGAAGVAAATDPHYRPGGTSDYVPRGQAAATTASVPAEQLGSGSQAMPLERQPAPTSGTSRYGTVYPSDAPASVPPPTSSYPPAGTQYDYYRQ